MKQIDMFDIILNKLDDICYKLDYLLQNKDSVVSIEQDVRLLKEKAVTKKSILDFIVKNS